MKLSIRQRRAVRRGAVVASVGGLIAGVLAVVPALSLASHIPGTTVGPYLIDGHIPDSNAGSAISDVYGANKELGPINGTSTKIGVIHSDAPPTLGLTNPNAQVDLRQVWLDLQRQSGNDYLYFGWERDSNSGSGFIAYEFMHNAAPTACVYTGTPTETSLAACNPWANRSGPIAATATTPAWGGDFMILWDQQGGSRDLYKRVWSGTAPNLTLGAPVPLGANAAAEYSVDGFRGEAAVNLTGAGLTSGSA